MRRALCTVLFLVSLACAACTRDSGASTATPAVPGSAATALGSSGGATIESAGWAIGFCAGKSWECASRFVITPDTVTLTVGLREQTYETTGAITERGTHEISQLAQAVIRSNPQIRSGGCGAACDGLTFTLQLADDTSQWNLTWGFIKTHQSPIGLTYDRLSELAGNMARCTDDPWVSLDEASCNPIPQ